MATCKNCGKPISDSTASKLCRSCSQVASIPKKQATCMKRYGVKNPMESQEFIDKIAKTMMQKYGVKCAMEVPEFLDKYKETCMEKYGVPYYVLTDDYISNSHFCISEINKLVAKKLEENGLEVEFEKVIEDKHYDLHVKGTKILLEIDPTYTHNAIGNHWDKRGMDKNYHKMKTAIAAENGFRVIHIWDWDDLDKITNMLLPKKRIFARNCKLKEVSSEEYKKFVTLYHLQGQTRGFNFCLGLYLENELIQIMSWGKPRFNKNYKHELLRLCTKCGYYVVGGAEKLFNHSIQRIGNESIISYCDLAKFSGDVYSRLGMKLLRINEPQEVWSKGKERILSTTLRQLGYDKLFGTNYGKGTSNEKLMIESGWLPVFDCGQAVYVYNEIREDNDNVENTSNLEEYKKIAESVRKSKTRLCKFCNKEFIPNSSHQIYCKGPHIRICPICGKEYEEKNVENLKRPPHACSYPCRVKKTRQTSLCKYGCVAPGNNPQAREKAKATMKEKFGAEYTLQSKELKERIRQTLLNKYGVENPNQIESAKAKRKASFQIKQNTLLFYQEPRIHSINANELDVYKLDTKYSDEWLNKYHPFKAPKGTVLSLGLCNSDKTYCIMTFKKSRNTKYVAELSRLWMLPTYNVVDGYQVLSQQASDFGLYNIVAYVNLSFENVNDYKSIGMKYLRTNQRTKWWLRNNEIVSDASRRQKGLSHNDMVFMGYGFAYDCGIEVYEFLGN